MKMKTKVTSLRCLRRKRRQSCGFAMIIGVSVLIFAFLVAAGGGESSQNLTPAYIYRIIDGDTIDVIMPSGEIERIRLIGIDAPEMGRFGSEGGAQPGAIEARDFVANLLPIGAIVWLEASGNDRDRWGRLRRYVWLIHTDTPQNDRHRRTKTLNRILLDAGHAARWP